MDAKFVKRISNDSGSTLIEVLVAMLIVAITTIGGMALYFSSSELKGLAVHKKMATELASSELEKYRAMTCAAITAALGTNDNQWTDYTLAGLTLEAADDKGKKVNITPRTGYCEIELSIKWNETTKLKKDYDMKLITYVAP